MDVRPTWVFTWHRMDHVSWSLRIFSKNHLLEAGLTQNKETMALRTLTIVDLFYSMCEDHRMNRNSLKEHLVEGPITWLHTTLEGPWPHYMILKVCWDDGLWTLSFGLSQFHGHGSWLVCEVALSDVRHMSMTPWGAVFGETFGHN